MSDNSATPTPILDYLRKNSDTFKILIEGLKESMSLKHIAKKNEAIVMFPHNAPGVGLISIVGLLINYRKKDSYIVHNEIYIPPLPSNLSSFEQSFIFININDIERSEFFAKKIISHINLFLTQYMPAETVINACLQSFFKTKETLSVLDSITNELQQEKEKLPIDITDFSITYAYVFYNLKIERTMAVLISLTSLSGIWAPKEFMPAKALEDMADTYKLFEN